MDLTLLDLVYNLFNENWSAEDSNVTLLYEVHSQFLYLPP